MLGQTRMRVEGHPLKGEGGKSKAQLLVWELERVNKPVSCQKVERLNGPFAWQFWKHSRQLHPTECIICYRLSIRPKQCCCGIWNHPSQNQITYLSFIWECVTVEVSADGWPLPISQVLGWWRIYMNRKRNWCVYGRTGINFSSIRFSSFVSISFPCINFLS